jgi:peptide/nickel transport system substrate-binding protein
LEEEDLTEAKAPKAEDRHETAVQLRGERASLAVARFVREGADLVSGGTAGDLPIARAARLPRGALNFDPVAGLFGLSFQTRQSALKNPQLRRALAMAIDRDAIVAALAAPGLQPRETLVAPGLNELPQPATPDWATIPLPQRRAQAAEALAPFLGETPVTLKVAMPEGPGYRLIFAFLRRDWRAIGVDAQSVKAGAQADLYFIDEVAPAELATWYLRKFTCSASSVCDAEADQILASARLAPTPEERRTLLGGADRRLTDITAFIPIAAPVRWSLVSPRLSGFRPNIFGRHNIAELVPETR